MARSDDWNFWRQWQSEACFAIRKPPQRGVGNCWRDSLAATGLPTTAIGSNPPVLCWDLPVPGIHCFELLDRNRFLRF